MNYIVTGKDHQTGLIGTLACIAENEQDAASKAAAKGLVPLSIISANAGGAGAAPPPARDSDAVASGVARGIVRVILILVGFFSLLLPGIGIALGALAIWIDWMSGTQSIDTYAGPGAMLIMGLFGCLLTWLGYWLISKNWGPRQNH